MMPSEKHPDKRVLLCDDDPTIRELLKVILSILGCELAGECENGSEALTMFKQESPDLLLLDINMPIVNGITALGDIIEDFPNANIVMLSGMQDTTVAEACLNKGAMDYIQKGQTPEALIAELGKILNKI